MRVRSADDVVGQLVIAVTGASWIVYAVVESSR